MLFMAIHGALHIFNPPISAYDRDGLDNYRYYVFSIIFLVPTLPSSLAFINPDAAYTYQGTFC